MNETDTVFEHISRQRYFPYSCCMITKNLQHPFVFVESTKEGEVASQ